MTDLSKYCDGLSKLKTLVLRDGCFRIEDGANELIQWCCYKDLMNPTDGFKRILYTISENSNFLLFDNHFTEHGSPDSYSPNLLTRGVLLYFMYASKDIHGAPVNDEDLTVGLRIYDYNDNNLTIPIYNAYMSIWNPVSDNKSALINKIEVINDNDFEVTVSGLILLGDKDGVTLDNTRPGC